MQSDKSLWAKQLLLLLMGCWHLMLFLLPLLLRHSATLLMPVLLTQFGKILIAKMENKSNVLEPWANDVIDNKRKKIKIKRIKIAATNTNFGIQFH